MTDQHVASQPDLSAQERWRHYAAQGRLQMQAYQSQNFQSLAEGGVDSLKTEPPYGAAVSLVPTRLEDAARETSTAREPLSSPPRSTDWNASKPIDAVPINLDALRRSRLACAPIFDTPLKSNPPPPKPPEPERKSDEALRRAIRRAHENRQFSDFSPSMERWREEAARHDGNIAAERGR